MRPLQGGSGMPLTAGLPAADRHLTGARGLVGPSADEADHSSRVKLRPATAQACCSQAETDVGQICTEPSSQTTTMCFPSGVYAALPQPVPRDMPGKLAPNCWSVEVVHSLARLSEPPAVAKIGAVRAEGDGGNRSRRDLRRPADLCPVGRIPALDDPGPAARRERPVGRIGERRVGRSRPRLRAGGCARAGRVRASKSTTGPVS